MPPLCIALVAVAVWPPVRYARTPIGRAAFNQVVRRRPFELAALGTGCMNDARFAALTNELAALRIPLYRQCFRRRVRRHWWYTGYLCCLNPK